MLREHLVSIDRSRAESFPIRSRFVGCGCPCLIISEIGQAHDGSLGTAHAYIDAVAKTGADAIKFQTHIAHAESSSHEVFRVPIFPQDATRYDYWKRMEFTAEQWAGLATHADEKGLIFLSTPFSSEAVELLDRLDIAAWKIGSGEIDNHQLLKKVAKTGKPVLLSSGMSSWSDLDRAVACVRDEKAPLAVLQCTTEYPCPAEKIGLNIIHELQQRYRCPVGLSDHSGTIYASLGAIALGVALIEVHTIFSKECFGPDVSSSVTTTELRQLVEGARFIERAASNPLNKDMEAVRRADIKQMFGKSLFAARDLDAGSTLTGEDILARKPGTGILARRIGEFVNRKIMRSYVSGELLQEKDFE